MDNKCYVNKKEIRPILVVPTVAKGSTIVFLKAEKKLMVKNSVETIWRLLDSCDGYKTIQEICLCNFEKRIIEELMVRGILCDSSEQYKHFHEVSCNPQYYQSIIDYDVICKSRKNRKSSTKKGVFHVIEPDKESDLYRLQNIRTSCRSFKQDSNITLQDIGKICDIAYSRERHATPSGGSLYPLYIYCVVQYEQPYLQAGIYEYDSLKSKLVLYKNFTERDEMSFCYNDETNAYNSPIQIIICADLEIQGEKYSNLGYRLTLIEVGHVAQNILLYSAERGFDTCELGGILDGPIARKLELDSNIQPMLAIAVGKKSNTKLEDYPSLLKELQRRYVGIDKVVKSVGLHKLGNEATIFGSWAKFGDHDKNIAGATGKSTHSALSKAIIEAYERYRSGVIKVDYTGKSNDAIGFLSPSRIAPIDSKTRGYIGLSDYVDGETVIDWTVDMSGDVLLPTDYVFYGNQKNATILFSNSSGVAAYVDYGTAKKRAVAELVERDAVMCCWYSRKAPMHLAMKHIPKHMVEKIEQWKTQGRRVHILYMEAVMLNTFMCIIESDEFPFFVSGSATSVDNIVDSVEKCYQEAEYNLLLAMKYPCNECPIKESVKTPQDHGQYYHFKQNAEKIKWIWSNTETIEIEATERLDFEEIYKKLNVVFVDLSEFEDDFIKVVRAVSPVLIPIGFGYKRDFPLHPRVKEVCDGYMDEPHFFA